MLIVRNSVKVLTRYPDELSHHFLAHEYQQAHLEDHGTLEDNQHERGKQRVIPVLVQTPERHTKHLEDEERRYSVFRK
jgi:hypothetical protein